MKCIVGMSKLKLLYFLFFQCCFCINRFVILKIGGWLFFVVYYCCECFFINYIYLGRDFEKDFNQFFGNIFVNVNLFYFFYVVFVEFIFLFESGKLLSVKKLFFFKFDSY